MKTLGKAAFAASAVLAALGTAARIGIRLGEEMVGGALSFLGALPGCWR